MTNTIRTFRTTVNARPDHGCDNFNRVTYTITETLTMLDDGRMKIVTVAKGWDGDERIDQRDERICAPGPTMEACAQYRLTHGYTEVK